ncbi:MAG: HEXXH motif-containing putative peptide modification protein [Hyphomicrobiales bacterium]
MPVGQKAETIGYISADAVSLPSCLAELIDKIGDDTFSFAPVELSNEEFMASVSLIKFCLDKIEGSCPDLYSEIKTIIQRICFFKIQPLDSSAVMYSGSKLNYLVCVFINAAMAEHPLYFWTDKLVHEAAHQMLLAIMLEEEVVLNPDRERYKSPLRTEGRTLTGIYHAAFVIYRIVLAFHHLLRTSCLSDRDRKGIERSLSDYIVKFDAAYEVIRAKGRLTEYGSALMASCEKAVRNYEQMHDATPV